MKILFLETSKDIMPEPWKTYLVYAAAIVLTLNLLFLIFKLFTKAKKLKAKLFSKISKWYSHRSLVKAAISNDIEAVINETVLELKDELPEGWFHKFKIEWVKNENIAYLKDGESIIRLRPMESQDLNLLRGVFHFFSTSLFPKTKDIVPNITRNAITIQLSKRTIKEHKPYLSDKFDDEIIEYEINKHPEILNYLDSFERLDRRGFFTGALLREIDYTASQIRFSSARLDFEKEILAIIEHMLKFMSSLPDAPDNLWARSGSTHSYRFLLAKNPFKSKEKIYVNRALKAYDDKIERLYVLGTSRDKKFVEQVIKEIIKSTKYRLIEKYSLCRDFRKKRHGVGALFSMKK